MVGIPVHTASPINPNRASKENGASPSTAAARYAPVDSTSRASQDPASISTVFSTPNYTAAKPGSMAGTAAALIPHSPLTTQPTPTATILVSTTLTASSPPSPQPSAVPSPFYSEARRASIPPPPKANEIPKPAAYYAPQYQGTPTPNSPQALSLNTSLPPLPAHQAQGTLLTPTRAQPPSAVTSIATPTAMTTDLSHPPGYIQDSRASFSERPPELVLPIAHNHTGGHSRGKSRNGGILDGAGGHDRLEDEDKGLWDTAVSWAKTVGEKVIEGEEEVWKRINGQR